MSVRGLQLDLPWLSVVSTALDLSICSLKLCDNLAPFICNRTQPLWSNRTALHVAASKATHCYSFKNFVPYHPLLLDCALDGCVPESYLDGQYISSRNRTLSLAQLTDQRTSGDSRMSLHCSPRTCTTVQRRPMGHAMLHGTESLISVALIVTTHPTAMLAVCC